VGGRWVEEGEENGLGEVDGLGDELGWIWVGREMG